MLSLLLSGLLLLHLPCIPQYLDGCSCFVFLFDVIPTVQGLQLSLAAVDYPSCEADNHRTHFCVF